MKGARGFLGAVVLVGVVLPALAQTPAVMPLDEAVQRIGETVTIEDKVMGVASSPDFQATYVNFGGAYPWQKLSVLFAGEHEAIIRSLPRLNGRMMRVTGVMEKGRKGPVIRVTNMAQIVVAKLDAVSSLDADGDGLIFRRQLMAAVVERIQARDYATLETVGNRWNQGRERLMEGTWKIGVFFQAFSPGDKQYRCTADEVFERLREWEQAYPGSILPRLIHADVMVDWAWIGRGINHPYRATAENQKIFEERLAQARQELAALHARRTECPEWYRIMLKVARAQGWSREEYDAVYDEAARFEPEYIFYHYEKYAYLMPHWYGRAGDDKAFVESLLTRYPEGQAEEIYALLAWYLRREADEYLREIDGRFFPDMGFRWEPMKAGFERLRVRYPKSTYVVNGYAVFAGKASDWDTTQRLLLELGDKCDMDIWVTWENVAAARMWAAGKGLTNLVVSNFR